MKKVNLLSANGKVLHIIAVGYRGNHLTASSNGYIQWGLTAASDRVDFFLRGLINAIQYISQLGEEYEIEINAKDKHISTLENIIKKAQQGATMTPTL